MPLSSRLDIRALRYPLGIPKHPQGYGALSCELADSSNQDFILSSKRVLHIPPLYFILNPGLT